MAARRQWAARRQAAHHRWEVRRRAAHHQWEVRSQAARQRWRVHLHRVAWGGWRWNIALILCPSSARDLCASYYNVLSALACRQTLVYGPADGERICSQRCHSLESELAEDEPKQMRWLHCPSHKVLQVHSGNVGYRGISTGTYTKHDPVPGGVKGTDGLLCNHTPCFVQGRRYTREACR
jgi:hypothetical protein